MDQSMTPRESALKVQKEKLEEYARKPPAIVRQAYERLRDKINDSDDIEFLRDPFILMRDLTPVQREQLLNDGLGVHDSPYSPSVWEVYLHKHKECEDCTGKDQATA